MLLRKIQIFGFRSFSDRAEIDFVPGINCIVGPGGSGKSNILDAINWVVEGKSKNPECKSSLGPINVNEDMTEVTLTFTNPKKPSRGLKELILTRRLSIAGKSKYLLNGKSCTGQDVRKSLTGYSLCFYVPGKDNRLPGFERFIAGVEKKSCSLCIVDDIDGISNESVLKIKLLLRPDLGITQLLVATQRKDIMEIADKIVGVTAWDEKKETLGASRILDVKLK